MRVCQNYEQTNAKYHISEEHKKVALFLCDHEPSVLFGLAVWSKDAGVKTWFLGEDTKPAPMTHLPSW